MLRRFIVIRSDDVGTFQLIRMVIFGRFVAKNDKKKNEEKNEKKLA